MIPAATDTYRLVSLKCIWSLSGLTAGEGPVLIGVARGGYNDAQIEEAIEASNIDRGSLTLQEQANRFVREIGVVVPSNTEGSINDGKMVTTKLNWLVPIGESVSMWAYNLDSATLTTGAEIDAVGNAWVKDT